MYAARQQETQRREKSGVGPIAGLFAIFALIHSLCASRQVKQLARRLAGDRHRDGLYRFVFNASSVVFVAPAAVWFTRLPDRTLYRLRAPWSWAMRAVQIASLLMAVDAARVVGPGKITGIRQAVAWAQGDDPVREPEAQGPPLADDGTMRAAGPFRFTRHPLNLAPIGIFPFFPHMTVNRAVLALLSVIYLILGSVHEELRLRAAYGESYRRYQKSGVPFMFPRPR